LSLRETLGAIGTTVRICIPTVAAATINAVSLEKSDRRLDWWSKKLLDDAEVSLEIVGRENVPADEPLVVMSNHRSYYDIPVMFRAVSGRLRMVAKKELFYVPLFGTAMLAAGFVRIDREKRTSAVESLKRSGDLLKSGTRVWIAPEGTRSKDGTLGPFKSGGFHLAIDNRVRILPVALVGTESIMPASGFTVHKGARVRATVLPPIDTNAYGAKGRKDLTEAVRKAIQAGIDG
jgi:1-acyl-sn-glycerol-3-phosphate acyltransferase